MNSAGPGIPQTAPPAGAFAATFPPTLFPQQTAVTPQQNGKSLGSMLPSSSLMPGPMLWTLAWMGGNFRELNSGVTPSRASRRRPGAQACGYWAGCLAQISFGQPSSLFPSRLALRRLRLSQAGPEAVEPARWDLHQPLHGEPVRTPVGTSPLPCLLPIRATPLSP